MKKGFILFMTLVASIAMAEPQMAKQLEQVFEKYEVYDTDGAEFTVEVDYLAHHACGRSYGYVLSNIDDDNLIVTKRVLPRRAYCPSPDRWPLIVEGLRFTVTPEAGSRINAKYLWVPKGSQVVLRGPEATEGLPKGMLALSLSLEPKRALSPGLSANIFGAFSNANSSLVLGEPKVDAKKRVALIEVKVKEQNTDLPTPDEGLGFAESVAIDSATKGLWTVVLVDKNGNSLRKEQIRLK